MDLTQAVLACKTVYWRTIEWVSELTLPNLSDICKQVVPSLPTVKLELETSKDNTRR